MRDYEVVYIYDASFDEAAVTERLERYHEIVAGKGGGEVTAIEHWGTRQLAYPIDRHRTGYYSVAQFRTDPQNLPEFERLLKLDDDLIRYLVVLSEGEPTSGMSVLAPEAPSSGDEDDDLEDDDDDEDDDLDDDLDDDEDEDDGSSPPEFTGGRGRRRRHEGPSIQLLNYKDVTNLSKFVTEQGKILPKRTTKVNAAFQRKLSVAVKRARFLALLPYVQDHEA